MNPKNSMEHNRQQSLKIWAEAQRRALHESVKNTPVNPVAAAAAGTGSGGGGTSAVAYYLRATESDSNNPGNNLEPWDEPNNLNDMDAVFGTGNWALDYFETLDIATVFNEKTTYIFIDGSDGGAEALSDLLSNAYTPISEWVFAGGKLFLNAAPNVGGNINFGFGGVVLNFADAVTDNTFSDNVTIAEGAGEHPIFNGTGTDWTGDSFAHAILTGNFNQLIVNPGTEAVCAELEWGSGKVIFGGMTITLFQDPKPEVTNLRRNIHSYLSGVSYTPESGSGLRMASPFNVISSRR